MRFSICFSVLAVLAMPALAVPVNPDSPTGVAATFMAERGDNLWVTVMATDGTICSAILIDGQDPDWIVNPLLPVDIHEIADWTPRLIVTNGGVFWIRPVCSVQQ